MKSQQQILYDALYRLSDEQGYDTYVDKPMYDVAYPFVYIRNADLRPIELKRIQYAEFETNIEIFSTSRKEARDIADNLLSKMQVLKAGGFSYRLQLNGTTVREFQEQVGNHEVIHYLLIEARFKNI